MEPVVGFEPTTDGLQNRCSTTELNWPSGTYFGRVGVAGKLIRRSLETHVLSVAKVKLSDVLQDYRRLAINKGQSVKGEGIIELFRKEIKDDANNQPRTNTKRIIEACRPRTLLADVATTRRFHPVCPQSNVRPRISWRVSEICPICG